MPLKIAQDLFSLGEVDHLLDAHQVVRTWILVTGSSTQLYTGDPAHLATARGSASPSPAARTPATCAAMGTGGERQPRHWAARYCQ